MSIVVCFCSFPSRLLRLARLMTLSLGGLGLMACEDLDYPRDPDETLSRVLAEGRLRAAAADHVPWVVVEDDGVPRGAEVDLVEGFARELGVAVEWRRAPAFVALEALERGEADLAIGGFTREAVTAEGSAGQTYPYFSEAIVVAADPGTPVPQALDGLAVHVAPELLANRLVADESGVPVAEKAEGVRLTALPDWQIARRGLVATGIVLDRSEHVIAVPRGENAWIMRLERFLRTHAATTGAKLGEHAQ
ncbi:MAG: transporter substrate-binding domain-containing protein [Rhodospirillales bacterium]|nr:transporter substrate-binding domain-containing protein [Rhodospirillales bacterium]